MITVLTELQDQNKKLMEQLAKGSSGSSRPQLVDVKGIGRPGSFAGDDQKFVAWATKTKNYITSVFSDLGPALEWAVEVDVEITAQLLDDNFGSNADELDRIDDVHSKLHQVKVVLTQLTENEAFDIVRNCGETSQAALEAWRKLHRRYDPSTVGRKTALLQAILHPHQCKNANDLPSTMERWEELVRRYERRKDLSGNRNTLPEDVKMGILEMMVPHDMQRHIYMNRSKLTNYDTLRNEIVLYYESILGARNPIASDRHRNDPMDIGAMQGKGGKGGKGKGKGPPQDNSGGSNDKCLYCGKRGHWANQCRKKQRDMAAGGKGNQQYPPPPPPYNPKGGKPKGKGKGKGGKGKSKGKGKGKRKDDEIPPEEATAEDAHDTYWDEQEYWEEDWGEEWDENSTPMPAQQLQLMPFHRHPTRPDLPPIPDFEQGEILADLTRRNRRNRSSLRNICRKMVIRRAREIYFGATLPAVIDRDVHCEICGHASCNRQPLLANKVVCPEDLDTIANYPLVCPNCQFPDDWHHEIHAESIVELMPFNPSSPHLRNRSLRMMPANKLIWSAAQHGMDTEVFYRHLIDLLTAPGNNSPDWDDEITIAQDIARYRFRDDSPRLQPMQVNSMGQVAECGIIGQRPHQIAPAEPQAVNIDSVEAQRGTHTEWICFDSGCSVTSVPRDWCKGLSEDTPPNPKDNRVFIGANGFQMYPEGYRYLTAEFASNGRIVNNWGSVVTDCYKPLLSVQQTLRLGDNACFLDGDGGAMLSRKSEAWGVIQDAIDRARESYPREFTSVKVFNQCYYIKMAFSNPRHKNNKFSRGIAAVESEDFPQRQVRARL